MMSDVEEGSLEEKEEPLGEREEPLEQEGGAEDEVGGVTEVANETAMDRESGDESVEEKAPRKVVVPGVVYLGHIPPRMRPKHVRNMLGVHGEIGRIFLQAEDHSIRKKKKKAGCNAKSFTEGWVEFRDKRVAKNVAASLHNTPMGARKRSRFHDDLWNIKYLHRFKWAHLSERLAYEKTVRQQRMRVEISQAKRETNFYLDNVEKSRDLARLRQRKSQSGQPFQEPSWGFTQRQTEEEIQRGKQSRGPQGPLDKSQRRQVRKAMARTQEIEKKSQSNVSLLAKIFNARGKQD
ncbi:activator of basal mRNAion 1 [Huso huso]|uniref:Activator of basal transcription 1 n=1 Tax=Huso huso TaxID=61971 RepID=A0ABR0Y477_HUSHU